MTVDAPAEPEAGIRTAPPQDAGIGTQLRVLTGRSLRALVLDPRLVVASMLGPLLMLGMFSQLFGSVARAPGFPPGVRYVDFLVPAIMVTSAMQAALNTAVGLTQEMRNGIIARFRSMPIWPGSVLLARSAADTVRCALQQLLLIVLAAVLLGFRPAGGPLGALGAAALALAVGCCLGWIFIAIACWIRNTELVQSVAGLATFPLVFASNAFVPASALPGWLRAVVGVNPATYGIRAARAIALGGPALADAATALAVSAAVGAAAAALAIKGFRRGT
ncbi:ABC transporter permease [Actinomadura verrucosospora]|uniref:Transport permease protein n=1 Tax=Actinomadura verrucosospora TaxID=46165 RepID=A0A7D3ZMX3_ACTVE|nr:ABC transporter permease [Actinomadura verrucosospora]QKG22302.1 ABC-type transporter [Actinomadura verrucosospora]